jgi:hypothetical protein
VKTNFLLIDHENVQPEGLPPANGGQFKVKVFLGSHQTRVNVNLARALQALGPDAVEYVTVEGNGRNALDFHIAYYIGRLAAENPDAFFHIVSKDTGFDPLIRHLKARKVLCQRSPTVADIPLVKLVNSKSLPEKVEAIVANLARRGTARPRKVRTLESTINALFQNQLPDGEAGRIIAELQKLGVVTVQGEKVSYSFDGSAPG